MGCDIHLTVEYRDPVTRAWRNDELREQTDYEEKYLSNGEYDQRYYTSRNYDLFAILANVRNGYGFAGSDTGDGFVPIASPRGVPDDATDIYRQWVDQWSGDGHSHSWFTVAELMAYDWTQTAKHRGYVGYKDLARWKLTGKPESWSSMVIGPDIRRHEGEHAIELISPGLEAIQKDWYDVLHGYEGGHFDENKKASNSHLPANFYKGMTALFGPRPYFHIEWETPYYDSARQFLGETLPRLWRLGVAEDVRIVFFFDN